MIPEAKPCPKTCILHSRLIPPRRIFSRIQLVRHLVYALLFVTSILPKRRRGFSIRQQGKKLKKPFAFRISKRSPCSQQVTPILLLRPSSGKSGEGTIDRGTIHACHSACDANPAEAHTVASWVAGEDTWPCITLIRFSVTLAEVSTKDVPFAEDCLLPRLRFAWRIQSYPLCVGKCTPLRRELYLHVSTPNAIARRDLQQMRALTATSNPVKP